MKKWLIILSVIGFCLGFGVTQYFNSCAYLNKKADKLFLQDEFEKAVSLYQKAVDRGDGYACYRLGRLYQRGIGVDSVDKEKAISLFKTGSERGCIEAKVCVALYYLAGGDAKVNKEKGAEILNHLFETTDNVFVKTLIGYLYYFGEYEFWPKDEHKGFTLLQECAEYDDLAAGFLGKAYFNGEYVTVEYTKGLHYLQLADSMGSSSAPAVLGTKYLMGEGGVKKNKQTAIRYFEKGVKRGNVESMVILSILYFSDEDYKDETRSLSYLNQAIKRKSGQACSIMGKHYMKGLKTLPKDEKKAFEFFKKSAQYGDPDGTNWLGVCYFYGIGTERNPMLAEQYWKGAAYKGEGNAAWSLYVGITLGTFKGTEADAKKYFKIALDKNQVDALKMWAHQYVTGCPIFKDDIVYTQPQQAFRYMEIAADQGDAQACATIAEWYEHGYGCDMNKAEAERYRNMVGVEKALW